jgi:hypothetical protein
MKLQRAPKWDHASMLARLEEVPEHVASEWLRHRYYSTCVPRVALCPKCGGQLRTWRAKLCLHCGYSWRELTG